MPSSTCHVLGGAESGALGRLENTASWRVARGWLHRSCPSTFQKKSKTGSHPRPTLSILKQQQLWQNGTKDYETTAPTYEQVLYPPASQKKTSNSTSEESDLHYADIHVLRQIRPHSLHTVKCLHSESATEYATLRFPQATPQYDSNNGTLV